MKVRHLLVRAWPVRGPSCDSVRRDRALDCARYQRVRREEFRPKRVIDAVDVLNVRPGYHEDVGEIGRLPKLIQERDGRRGLMDQMRWPQAIDDLAEDALSRGHARSVEVGESATSSRDARDVRAIAP